MKTKKIFMAMLASLFLFYPATPLMASEYAMEQDTVVTYTDQEYTEMIQSALDDIGMPLIPYDFDVDSDNFDDLLEEIFRELEAPIFNVMNYIVETIDFDSLPNRSLEIRDLQHDIMEDIVVTINMDTTSLNYTTCLINMGLMTSDNHEYVNGIWVPKDAYLYEYVDGILVIGNDSEQRNNPYNQIGRNSANIMDVNHTTLIIGRVEGTVRFFRRADGMNFVQEGSHRLYGSIYDNRLLSGFTHDYNILRDNGTRIPDVRIGYAAQRIGGHINQTTHELRIFV